VKEAGITFSVTVILGLGGIERSQEHVFETAKVLTEIEPSSPVPRSMSSGNGMNSVLSPLSILG